MKKLLTVLLIFTVSFSFGQDELGYEYTSLTQKGARLMICYSSAEFSKSDVYKEKRKNKFDFSPILKRVTKLEGEGWEVFSTVGYAAGRSGYPVMHFMMRRKKK